MIADIRPKRPWVRLLRVVGATVGALVALYFIVGFSVRPYLASWGATRHEQKEALAGDDLVRRASTQVTLGVDIQAPPERVYPWLVQMGVDRAGLYTYTWFENGVMRLGAHNADALHPEWQDLKPGDVLAFTPADYPTGRTGPLVASMSKNESVVLCGGADLLHCRSTLQFVLVWRSDGTSRLLFRGRSDARVSLWGRLPDLILEPGYLTMERKMLLGIKERAERG